jgi:hypothetical protein
VAPFRRPSEKLRVMTALERQVCELPPGLPRLAWMSSSGLWMSWLNADSTVSVLL